MPKPDIQVLLSIVLISQRQLTMLGISLISIYNNQKEHEYLKSLTNPTIYLLDTISLPIHQRSYMLL